MTEAFTSTLMNLAILAGVPFLIYTVYHMARKKRSFAVIARRAGLCVGETRYLGYSALFAVIAVVGVAIWPPSLESSTSEGSAFRQFAGMGLGAPAVVMALLYGVLKTGFAEEFLFRGLIAGSLSRRWPMLRANVAQAFIFLLPHLAILLFAPDMGKVLPLVFAGALVAGWLRVKSGSILGPWLIHAAVNVTTALSVVVRSGNA